MIMVQLQADQFCSCLLTVTGRTNPSGFITRTCSQVQLPRYLRIYRAFYWLIIFQLGVNQWQINFEHIKVFDQVLKADGTGNFDPPRGTKHTCLGEAPHRPVELPPPKSAVPPLASPTFGDVPERPVGATTNSVYLSNPSAITYPVHPRQTTI